jgi:hypothetical protein
MIDDVKPSGRPDESSDKQKPLDIYTANESLKNAAVVRPQVDIDHLEAMMGQPPESDIPFQPDGRSDKTGKTGKQPSRVHKWWQARSKKQRALLIVLSLLVLGVGSGSAAYLVVHGHKPKAVADTKVVKKPVAKKPVITTVASQLTGLPVDPSLNQRPVVGVMIENSLDARPQSGLDQAGVVFEAIAEGGITRFLALFQDTQPDYVGPIRSVRPYYQQLAMGFDAPMAHVGGSPEALGNIKAWGVRDIDQFYNSGAYHRVSSRAAPHNVYSSLTNLTNLSIQKGYKTSTFTSLQRKKEQPYKAGDTRTPANSINMNISGFYYNTSYTYDAATNSYKRSMAGKPHMTVDGAGTQKQITPKVVVAMVMSYGLEADHKHSVYGTIGSGQAFIFQDGTVTPATWTKAARNEQFKFTDTAGKPIGLNPGQTWLTAIGSAGGVSYK